MLGIDHRSTRTLFDNFRKFLTPINSSETWTVLCWTGKSLMSSFRMHLAHTGVKHKPPRPGFAKTFQVKVWTAPIACQKTQNRLPKSGSGVSGFRVSNLTKTMANLQDLESFEPLNPLTPNPDFGNLFCVFWQAIGEFPFFWGKLLGNSAEGGSAELFTARKL